jgi:hypothetical protein
MHKIEPQFQRLHVQRGLFGVYPAGILRLPFLYPRNRSLRIRRQGYRLADTLLVVEYRLPQHRPKAIPGPIHDRVSGKPQIVATLVRGSGARHDERTK